MFADKNRTVQYLICLSISCLHMINSLPGYEGSLFISDQQRNNLLNLATRSRMLNTTTLPSLLRKNWTIKYSVINHASGDSVSIVPLKIMI